MKTATVKENLNQRGHTVDAEILSYLKACADRNQDDWASPSLADIARMARTSPFVVQERLHCLAQTERVVVDGDCWFVINRERKRCQTAAGFGGGDREFLRKCGIATQG